MNLKNISKNIVTLRWDNKETLLQSNEVLNLHTKFGEDKKLIAFLKDRFIKKAEGALIEFKEAPEVEDVVSAPKVEISPISVEKTPTVEARSIHKGKKGK